MFPHHLRRKARARPGRRRRRGHAGRILARISLYLLLIWGSIVAGTALYTGGVPAAWNPFTPFDPAAAPGPLTKYKLARDVGTTEACLAALDGLDDLRAARLRDRRVSDTCYIDGHVQVRGLSGASMWPVSTSCQTALRLYLWERHAVQPAARAYLAAEVARIDHLQSYACRPLRTGTGDAQMMSAHATARAIDISGVRLDDGRRLALLDGWAAPDTRERRFWRALRDGACDWFDTVLTPDFNSLHANHFHLGTERTGACR